MYSVSAISTDAPADVAVRVADHLRDLHQRDAVGAQLHRIDRHLVGLHEAADRGHFGDAVRLGQLVAHVPVLDRAQLGERLVLGEQGVLIDPADAGGVGPDLRRDAPCGMRPEAKLRYSSTRERAQ
jgi:hypothetical protein